RASVRPTEPTVNVAVFRAICQNWPLVSTLIQLSRPTKRLSGEIMSHEVKLRVKFWISGQYEKMARRIRFGPTNAAKVDHSRHSRLGRAVSGRSVVRVAALTIGCALG